MESSVAEMRSEEHFRSWGWILYLWNGKIRIYDPGVDADTARFIKIKEMYDANVALRWNWDHEDMWVYKNRWGNRGCWLSETVITSQPESNDEDVCIQESSP